jgi:hypothetical protein
MGRKSTIRLNLDAGSYQDVLINQAQRDKLQKICPKEGFVQAIEGVISRRKSNMDSVRSVSPFKKRKHFLDMGQRRVKRVLEWLTQGPRSRRRSDAQELLESIYYQDSEGNVGSVVNEALAALENLQIAITQAVFSAQAVNSAAHHTVIRCERSLCRPLCTPF